ncbi:hypothetical protein MAR_023417 [Mya arenaria]|uniref:Rho termination factor-like N-terminal domain-containing protein n=1 Tax=Mya arenaria TaxID=6604 RepID=A0ABY7DMW8_MYAAR|nr:hypothetical protein MAR_023417 [Mya arenaria]
MNNKTVKDLKAMAKERDLKRYSALRKAKLVDLLAQSTEHTLSLHKTVKDLKAMAKERGLERYSALRKAKLVDLLAQSTEHTSSLMDESIPDMGVATLQPVNVEHRAKHVKDNVIDHVPTPQRGLARDESLGDRVVIESSKRSSVWRYIQSSINHCEVTLIFHFPTSLNQKRQS